MVIIGKDCDLLYANHGKNAEGKAAIPDLIPVYFGLYPRPIRNLISSRLVVPDYYCFFCLFIEQPDYEAEKEEILPSLYSTFRNWLRQAGFFCLPRYKISRSYIELSHACAGGYLWTICLTRSKR